MPTTGIVNGTNLRLYSSATAIGHATSCTLSVSRAVRETLTKDATSSWRTVSVGQKSGTVSVEGLFSDDTTNTSAMTLFTALDNGTSLTLKVSTEVTGDSRWSFSGYCTSWELNGPVEENSGFSATFEIDGAITMEDVT